MVTILLLLLALIGGLTPNMGLAKVAQERAQKMVEQSYFAHDLSRYPTGYCGVGELLARSGPDTAPAVILTAWQRSPSHAYVLDTLHASQAGVGRWSGEDGATIWVLALARSC